MDDFDPDIADMLGPLPSRPPAPPPRPPRSERAVRVLDELVSRRRLDIRDESDEVSFDLTDVHRGVTVGWLAKAFGMDPGTVKKKLADCPPLHRRKAGYVYALPQAAAYLIKPVFDPDEYVRNMKPSELPTSLQKEFWDAQLKRQKWEENARQLWRTEDVLDVLGETFKALKFTIQLWTDNLERETGLSDTQRAALGRMTDGLQSDLHKSLVDMARKRATPSTVSELANADDV